MADKDKKELTRLGKITSPTRAVGRIIFGFFAFLIWILFGVPVTLLYTSGAQTFIGVISFIIRNPIIFLLIALINIFIGIISYIFLAILWYSAFHLIWSIRWFYGFNKYRNT